jgi:glycolate dehydrogenase FAD-binding subunit
VHRASPIRATERRTLINESHIVTDNDLSLELTEAVRAAGARAPLHIIGGGTKNFYGRAARGVPLSVARHRGIVSHEPTELVITARAGTPLHEIEAALASRDQMLAFEPPHFGERATLGGTIACGFSGPRRPYAGAARDFVLGVKIINGKGEILSFGGRVMKNVAGYDVSRLMVGALGTLGVLLEVSLKVLPRPPLETTIAFALPAPQALSRITAFNAQALPLSAAVHIGDTLYIRLSGAEQTVRAAQQKLGGEEIRDGATLWRKLREHELDFFAGDTPLWRISVPPAAPLARLSGTWLIDWAGAQRWLKSNARAIEIWDWASHVGGHAALFRGGDRAGEVFHPLSPALTQLHINLKQAFDPAGLLNIGRYTTAW